jgi:hypothetical protein
MSGKDRKAERRAAKRAAGRVDAGRMELGDAARWARRRSPGSGKSKLTGEIIKRLREGK